jgi:small neutral amino acid transporter SnatA (MarC family)
MWWQTWISEFVTLFLVINPFGALPTFLDIAAALDPRANASSPSTRF